MHRSDIDPDLERQLADAQAEDQVEAVLLLRPADRGEDQPGEIALLIERASDEDHDAKLNYLPRMGALIVRARSEVIRMLISQPAVEMASANRIGHSGYL